MGLNLAMGFPPDVEIGAGGIKPGIPLSSITLSATAAASSSLSGVHPFGSLTLAATGSVATSVLGVHTFSSSGIGADAALAAALRADGPRSLPSVTLAATAGVGPVARGMTYTQNIAGTGPIKYLPLNDTTGTSALELITGDNASYINTPTLAQRGIGDRNGAPLFTPGSSECVNMYSSAFNTAFNGAEFTLSIWARARDETVFADSTTRYLIALWTTDADLIRFYKGPGVNSFIFERRAGGTNKTHTFSTGPARDWIHFLVTCSESAGQIKIYVNNSLITTLTSIGTWAGTALKSTQCALGSNQNSGTSAWDGYLAHFAAWDRKVSDIERTIIATSPYDWGQTTYYVNGTTGNDTTGDGTAALPYATIAKATAMINTGNTHSRISVAAGTYAEEVEVPIRNLTYSASGAAIIEGGGVRNGFDSYSKYTAIDGFAIQNCVNGVYSRAGGWNTLRNLSVSGCTTHGIFLYYSPDSTVEDCEVTTTVNAAGLYAQLSARTQVQRCYLHDNTGYGLEIENSCDDSTVVDSWSITNNNGFIAKLSDSITFTRCVASGNTNYGFYAKGAPTTSVVNCDTYNNGNSGILFGDDTPGTDATSENGSITNTIIDSNPVGVWCSTGSASGFMADYNDYYNNTVTGKINVTTYTTLANWQAQTTEDEHSQAVDPDYATVVYGGFVPQAAAVLTGANDSGPQGHTG